VCDQETSKMRRPWPALGRSAKENKTKETERFTKMYWIPASHFNEVS